MNPTTSLPPPPTPAAPNLLHVQFKNPEFLSYLSSLQQQHHEKFDPTHPLNEYNVMNYFATSPFFDRRSNNEQLRMQNIVANVETSAMQQEQELKRFTGLEYILVHAKPPTCFVIHKRWRSNPDQATTLSVYYIINESIYQAPDLYSILSTRLQSTIHGLQASLTKQRSAKPLFNPRKGQHGRFIVPDHDHQDDDNNNDDDLEIHHSNPNNALSKRSRKE